MILAWLTLATALVISAVAIYYSVAGLAAIFASAVIPIVIMGVALEVGKLVTAVWLHKYWKRATWWLKTYLSLAVVVLMFITSMGIFGFLSKAHIDQTATAGDNGLQIQLIDQKIAREQKRIQDADLVISQLDKTVQVLLDANRIRGQNGAIATREGQKEERESLNTIIRQAQSEIAKLQDEKLVLEKEQVAIEAEVGPIKYIAEFIYGGEADKNLLEEAVRWVIVILIFVFDPLAVLLLIAAQYTFDYNRKDKEESSDPKGENDDVTLPPSGTTASSLSETDPDSGGTAPTPTIEEKQDDISVEKIDTDADATVRDMVSENNVPVDDAELQPVEQNEVQSNGLRPEEIAKPYIETEPLGIPEDTFEEPKKKESGSSVELNRLTEEELDALDENPEWQEAKHRWKSENPTLTLKLQKKLYLEGKIDKLPWESYVNKKDYIVKENAVQVKKSLEDSNPLTTESEDGYIQNAEQNESSIWNKIKNLKQR